MRRSTDVPVDSPPADLAPPRRSEVFSSLRVWLTWPAWLTLAVTMSASRLFPLWCARWQFVPFLVGLVFLGLPHGALDHLAPSRLLRRKMTGRYLLGFVLGYLALAALYLLFWRVQPLDALAVFLLLSWLHWGQGDAYFLRAFGGQAAPRSPAERFLIWAVRGGLPILLPALAFPLVLAQVAEGILAWYGGSQVPTLSPALRLAGLALLAVLAAVYSWHSWRRDRAAFGLDFGEICLLGIYFALTPPILAVGVYFCVWHSARHLARLMRLDDGCVSLARCLARTAWQAVPMTIGALGLLAGLWVWLGRRHVSAGEFVFLYLSLIAALTFPHFLLVLWMDRREGV